MTNTAAHVYNALQTINAWDNIADGFRQRGIRGWRTDACQCPVANYIKNYTSVSVAVCKEHVGFEEGDGWGNAPVPFRVADFIHRFDNGEYPDLEMRHAEVGAVI